MRQPKCPRCTYRSSTKDIILVLPIEESTSTTTPEVCVRVGLVQTAVAGVAEVVPTPTSHMVATLAFQDCMCATWASLHLLSLDEIGKACICLPILFQPTLVLLAGRALLVDPAASRAPVDIADRTTTPKIASALDNTDPIAIRCWAWSRCSTGVSPHFQFSPSPPLLLFFSQNRSDAGLIKRSRSPPIPAASSRGNTDAASRGDLGLVQRREDSGAAAISAELAPRAGRMREQNVLVTLGLHANWAVKCVCGFYASLSSLLLIGSGLCGAHCCHCLLSTLWSRRWQLMGPRRRRRSWRNWRSNTLLTSGSWPGRLRGSTKFWRPCYCWCFSCCCHCWNVKQGF
mmetsp:Transcript_34488/g.73479  ORF Transcript_34488/g.73479 Transcript_34488/m.73479 type:complete len:344 (-) Transcript_34488:512-1543(-)